MKTYKLMVEIYVSAEDQEDAENFVSAELDYLCGCDNNLMAYEFDYHTAEEQGETE